MLLQYIVKHEYFDKSAHAIQRYSYELCIDAQAYTT
jgi:hypothetical protein